MSIVIGYKKGDVVYMGTDTRVITSHYKHNMLCECDYKIQKAESGVLVGIVADKKIRQSIMAYLEIFTLDKNGQLTRKHIVTKIIPKLFDVLRREGLLIEKEGKEPGMDCGIMLAHKGNLFDISSVFTVYAYEDFQAIGISSDYGQCPLFMAKKHEDDGMDVNEVIVQTLDIIASHKYIVGRPYLLIDTKELEYKLIGSDNI